MTIRRLTLMASAAALTAAWALPAAAAPGAGVSLPAERAHTANVQQVGWFRNRRDDTYYVDGSGEHVRAPGADVDTNASGSRVRAPFVDVDTQGNDVRVRAPFVNIIRPKNWAD
ncbi:hypothetical protein A7A08_01653 [Methyloligella halotolerans]|uniref:Uncharacterized protein n=1 Tax=Methyloligella halotolerans TaxID=1177755 RepID=A0A1E2RZY7_9HYPH|nr:hypothetical protein [Methyloligella halotolerans]ODA67619.1 hypothetical protein A7A08_01653 [Methyloligella halotolerans]